MELYLNNLFITIFVLSEDTSTIFYKPIDKKAKRYHGNNKAYNSL